MAKSLEFAGKEGDLDLIHRDTEALLQKYLSLDHKLSGFDMQQGERKEFPEEMRREAFMALSEIAATMDYGLIDELLRGLREYDLSEPDEQLVTKMEKCLLLLDFDGIASLAGSVL